MQEYISVDELSDYIKLSKSTIYKLTASFRIPYIKTGKMLLFRKEAIDEWLNEKARQPIREIENNINKILKNAK
jgi:excisionase family DNA binding protein